MKSPSNLTQMVRMLLKDGLFSSYGREVCRRGVNEYV